MLHENLFTHHDLGDITLKNRFVMAPMTRSRSTEKGDVPNALMASYYSQRSSAGLIITEATQVSLQGKGYARTPGIYTKEQVEGWKKVTSAIHNKGGKAFLQLWHVGRVSSSKVNGMQPIGPSERKANNTQVYVFDVDTQGDATFIPVETPRAMSHDDINQVVNEFAQGARNAIDAGFDGVEIHGANGYLIDQFLRSNVNNRIDEYGKTQSDRIRLLTKITEAVVLQVGKERVGVRLSPFIKIKDMNDPEILATIMLAADQLNKLGIAYIHLCEADWEDAPTVPDDFRVALRKCFSGSIIVTGNKTPEIGNELIAKGWVDLIGFGRNFLANPDYPERVLRNAPLNKIVDTHTLFGGGNERGYTDYPFLDEEE